MSEATPLAKIRLHWFTDDDVPGELAGWLIVLSDGMVKPQAVAPTYEDPLQRVAVTLNRVPSLDLPAAGPETAEPYEEFCTIVERGDAAFPDAVVSYVNRYFPFVAELEPVP